MTQVTGRCLGRKAVKTDTRTLMLARYLTVAIPPPPPARDWTDKITNFGMMLNDQLGDCTIAGCGHAEQIWSANAGTEITIPDSSIEAAYSAWDGYVPGDPSTDNGGVELDVLNDWRQQGLDGRKIFGFASVRFWDVEEVRTAINLFGGIYIGIALPISAQSQDVWEVAEPIDGNSDPGSWGGHCVYVPAYDDKTFECITWGAKKFMTVDFWKTYVDEAYAVFGTDWINSGGEAPSGFDVQQLTADLAAIR